MSNRERSFFPTLTFRSPTFRRSSLRTRMAFALGLINKRTIWLGRPKPYRFWGVRAAMIASKHIWRRVQETCPWLQPL